MDIYGDGGGRVCGGWCAECVAGCSSRCGTRACPDWICFVKAKGSHDAVQSMWCKINMAEDVPRKALDV